MDIAARFGENLVRCRKRAGLSQEELGVRASLHRTEIGLLGARGAASPGSTPLIKLAGALCESRPASCSRGSSWTPGRHRASGSFSLAPSEPRSN